MSKKNSIAKSTLANVNASADAAVLDTQVPEQVEQVEHVVAETPKPESKPELKVKQTAVEDRLYRITSKVGTFKGKQRIIVMQSLTELLTGEGAEAGYTIREVTAIAKKFGLVAKGGVEPSVRYHLHHLTLLGYTEVINPTYMG